jgi:hypothetical protein
MLNQLVLVGKLYSVNAIHTISLDLGDDIFEIFLTLDFYEMIKHYKRGSIIGIKGHLEVDDNGHILIIADKISVLQTESEAE